MKSAIVIGAGIGGLAAALRLKHKGFEVKVFEANAYAGGKIHAYQLNGYRFDAGPSLFTLPSLVDELFSLFNNHHTVSFEYTKKDTICHYFWEDGTIFKAMANREDFIKMAADVFSESESTLRSYLERNESKYELTAPLFLSKSLHKSRTFFDPSTLKALLAAGKLDLSTTLHQVNKNYFKNPKLIQLFDRYATYNGSSPYRTPGIMSMIPHLEMNLGTYFPKGGMHRISQSLFELAKEVGIEFHFSERVNQIQLLKNRAVGIKSETKEYPTDYVVSNMDIYGTYTRLLPNTKPPKPVIRQERSTSGIIFYWGVRKTFPELDLHNILFSENYQLEFEWLFDKKDIHHDPTIYINITSKEAPTDAPEGCENWFVMINAPSNVGQDWARTIRTARKNILAKLKRTLKVDIEPLIQVEHILDPIKIEELTSSHQGSLYGTSSNDRMAAFLRHPNFSGRIPNLFFCGGSVHPGGGIPLCLLSAKIATDQIKA